MRVISTVFAIPLFVLNAIGGIVAGVWLAILGEWGALALGLLAGAAATLVLPLALSPSIAFIAPSSFFLSRRYLSWVGYAFVLLGNLWGSAVFSVWCLGVLAFFLHDAADRQVTIPLALWSYEVANGAIVLLARKELQLGGGSLLPVSALFTQVAYVVILILALFFDVSFFDIAVAFITIMVLDALVVLGLQVQLIEGERKAEGELTL